MEVLPPPASPSARPDASSEPAASGETDALAARLAALSARNRSADRTTARRSAGPQPSSDDATPQPKSRQRRRHAAKGARAAALGLSLASTGGLATLFALTGVQAGNEVQGASVVSTGVSAAPTEPAATTNTIAPATGVPATEVPVAEVPVAPATIIIDGGVFRNKWGDVQVRATFGSDGTLVDVVALQTPTRDSKSVRINDRAVPTLITEALTAQSANVDTVSGATYTSTDYRRSLQSAIDAAIDAGIVAPASA